MLVLAAPAMVACCGLPLLDAPCVMARLLAATLATSVPLNCEFPALTRNEKAPETVAFAPAVGGPRTSKVVGPAKLVVADVLDSTGGLISAPM